MIYVYLILSCVAFGVIHSVTASQWFKRDIAEKAKLAHRYYRLIYNALAILTFLPVLLVYRITPLTYMSSWQGAPVVGKLVIGLGLIISIRALGGYDLAEFLGWPVESKSSASQTLQQSGLLRYVRHPLYSGILLSLLGVWMDRPTWSHLILLLTASLYIRIGIHFEERKLVATFGDAYQHYRQRVPMLLPRLLGH
ncbi:isoprenylcysteine carboxylmethyltransferase family protein [soil metagenome]